MQTVYSVDDIKETDIKYRPIYSDRWFTIEKDEYGYCLHGMICGQMPEYLTESCNKVKYWKTFAGIKRAIKGFNKSGYWGFGGKFRE